MICGFAHLLSDILLCFASLYFQEIATKSIWQIWPSKTIVCAPGTKLKVPLLKLASLLAFPIVTYLQIQKRSQSDKRHSQWYIIASMMIVVVVVVMMRERDVSTGMESEVRVWRRTHPEVWSLLVSLKMLEMSHRSTFWIVALHLIKNRPGLIKTHLRVVSGKIGSAVSLLLCSVCTLSHSGDHCSVQCAAPAS